MRSGFFSALGLFVGVVLVAVLGFVPVKALAGEVVVFDGGQTGELQADGSITGTAYVGDWVNDAEYEQWFYVRMPDGSMTNSAMCLNPWHYAPSPGNYPFTATPSGGGWYNVTIHSAGNDNISPNQPWEAANGNPLYLPTQNVGGFSWNAKFTRHGRLAIAKQVEGGVGAGNVFRFNVRVYRDANKTDLYKTFSDVRVSQSGGAVDLGEDIPAGYRYVVEEVSDPHFRLASIEPSEGTIASGQTVTVTAHNVANGHGKVRKLSST